MSMWITIVLLWSGGVFVLLAGIGVLRFPDLFMRMHAASKAGSLGLACLGGAVSFYFGRLDVTCEALLIVGFFLLTAPVAAHVIGKAAYSIGVPLWERSVCDALAEEPVKSTEQCP